MCLRACVRVCVCVCVCVCGCCEKCMCAMRRSACISLCAAEPQVPLNSLTCFACKSKGYRLMSARQTRFLRAKVFWPQAAQMAIQSLSTPKQSTPNFKQSHLRKLLCFLLCSVFTSVHQALFLTYYHEASIQMLFLVYFHLAISIELLPSRWFSSTSM